MDFTGVWRNFPWFYWVEQGFIGLLLCFARLYWFLLGLIGWTWEFYWVSLDFYWVFFSLTRFNWLLLSLKEFYWVLLGWTGLHLVFTGFYRVFTGIDLVFIGCEWILTSKSLTGSYRIWLGFTVKRTGDWAPNHPENPLCDASLPLRKRMERPPFVRAWQEFH